jgi:hypothetical protein
MIGSFRHGANERAHLAGLVLGRLPVRFLTSSEGSLLSRLVTFCREDITRITKHSEEPKFARNPRPDNGVQASIDVEEHATRRA